jgi:hypothetical protein
MARDDSLARDFTALFALMRQAAAKPPVATSSDDSILQVILHARFCTL